MKKSSALLILIPFLISSCGRNSLDGYDNTNIEKLNTNLFYRNEGQVQAADPHVIESNGKYYLYATNANENGDCSYLQAWSSDDLTNWKHEGICYQPVRNSWCIDGLWAPEVIERDGLFYLYYCGWSLKNAIHELGVAISSSPVGPFVDFYGINDNGVNVDKNSSAFPLDLDNNGRNDPIIDASPFIDEDGTPYLYFVQDQYLDRNDGKHYSTIYVAQLNDDMVSIKYDTITKLIRADQEWEMESSSTSLWNEAPFVYQKNGIYYLFYSANFYQARAYCLGLATSTSPFGPFVKQTEPILKTKDYWDYVTGTGHNSIFTSPDGKETFITYHSHKDTIIGGAERLIKFDRIYFDNGKVHINGPTISPQLLPSGSSEYFNITSDAVIKVNGARNSMLKDNYINFYEDDLSKEFLIDTKNAEIKINFDSPRQIRAIMVYDSAQVKYCLEQIDLIKINDKIAKKVKICSDFFDNQYSSLKIPGSAFIYEFNEITSDEILIEINSNEKIYLNEIVVVGK